MSDMTAALPTPFRNSYWNQSNSLENLTFTLAYNDSSVNNSSSKSFGDPLTDLKTLYEIHRPIVSIIDRYLTPLWYIVGFPGNLLAFVVWIQRRMRHSSGYYLAALAMADFLFLSLQLIFELHSTWNVRVLNNPIFCETFPVLFLSSQYLSPLLVLAFTIERYISICHPFKRDRFCTTSRALKVIAGLVALSVSIHAIQGYFWQYNATTRECAERSEVTEDGPLSLWSVWSWVTELLVFGLVPLTILVLNVMVMEETRKLKMSEEKRLCLRKGHKNPQQRPTASTLTLMAVSFYLIFTTLPVTVCYVLYFSFPQGPSDIPEAEVYTDHVWGRHFTYWTVRTFVQKLGMSHYACNFYIYLWTGKLFRGELGRLFRLLCCRLKHVKSEYYSDGDGYTYQMAITNVVTSANNNSD